MRIFIDIGHPAHVHYFRNFIKIMEGRGHEFLVTARDRQHVFRLLDAYGIKYMSRGAGGGSMFSKLLYLLKSSFRNYLLARKFRPALFIDFGTMYSCAASSLLRKRHVVFEDTEITGLYRSVYEPLVDEIYTPECFELDLGRKHKRFKGYMELAYLHSNFFTPDVSVLSDAGLKKGDIFSIVRFVDWKAVHDIGNEGLTAEEKISLVKRLEKYGKVLISSELPLPAALQKYELRIEPEKLHSLMHFASLVIGESATMASEAAILGTPAVYIDNEGRGYTRDIEKKYGTLFNFKPDEVSSIVVKAEEILSSEAWKDKALEMREKIISGSVDLTAFMVEVALR